MVIHTYGDSHATHFGGWVDGKIDGIKFKGVDVDGVTVKVNHIPGKLAFSFGRDKMQVVNNVNQKDMVIFCFGEIDCRCHVNKYEPNWKENIDGIVKNYFETIKLNVDKFDDIGVCVYNVVPPLERDKPENHWVEIGATTPKLGSDEDRREYTLYMNEKLKEYCESYDYIFFDVYDEYSDENGFIQLDLSDTNCHIRNPKYMEEFITKNLI